MEWTTNICFLGATGNTGSATVHSLLKDHPNVIVRAGIRDVKKAESKFPGADSKRLSFVVSDVKSGDAGTIDLSGVDSLVIVPPQGHENRLGMVTAYVNAAKVAKPAVKHIVLISSPAVTEPTLALSKDLAAGELLIKASGIPYTLLHCVFFYENNFGNAGTIKEHSTFYAPINGSVKIGSVAVADIGEAASNAAVQGPSSHAIKTYWISAPNLSADEQASIMSRVLGRTVKFVSVSDEAATKALTGLGWPEFGARGLVELYRWFEAKQFPENTAPLQALLNNKRKPVSFEDWFSGVASAFGGSSSSSSSSSSSDNKTGEHSHTQPQTVFVAGSTGNVGSATVHALLKYHPTVNVRAGVRDQKKAEAKFGAGLNDAQKKRLSCVMADVKGSDTRIDLKGVNTLVFVPPQGTEDRAGVANAWIASAKAAGVKRIITITTPAAVSAPNLLLTKGLAEIESLIKASGLTYTFIQPVFFYENYFGSADTIKGHGAWYAPISGSAKMGGIAVADIGEATANVAATTSDVHNNKSYVISGPIRSNDENAQAFSSVLGKPVKFVAVSDDAALKAMKEKGFPDVFAKGFIELYRHFESGKDTSINENVLPTLLNEKRKATTLEQWLQPVASAFK
jgi:uncharacterized protein YbjT (DUF2867 family)